MWKKDRLVVVSSETGVSTKRKKSVKKRELKHKCTLNPSELNEGLSELEKCETQMHSETGAGCFHTLSILSPRTKSCCLRLVGVAVLKMLHD